MLALSSVPFNPRREGGEERGCEGRQFGIYLHNLRSNMLVSAGKRTRAARVTGEHSTTTEPPMQTIPAVRTCIHWEK